MAISGISGAVVLAGAATVSAAPASPPSARGQDPAVHATATTQADQQRIRQYWTTRRMRGATPAAKLVDDAGSSQRSAGRSERGEPATVPPASPASAHAGNRAGAGTTATAPEKGASWEGGGAVTRTTGKVFFTLGGQDYVCSGSAVNSDNKDVVLTAGHCVNEGPGEYASKWMFAPGYDHGKTPYGEWTSRTLLTTQQWKNNGNISYDVGFAVMNTLNGQHLVAAVGGQGIAFNQPRGELMYSFGYPAAPPYDGQDLIYCAGTVHDDPTGQTNDQGMGCDMTGGSSGGPWFIDFDAATGTGLLNSVNSFVYRNDPGTMYGPYFGTEIQEVYSQAETA